MERFGFATDATGDLGMALAGPRFDAGEIVVDDAEVTVAFGAPPVFAARIPRAAIRSAERAPALRGMTRGIHGWRGKWLVNRSGDDLVRLRIDPPAVATMSFDPTAIAGARLPKGRIGKALMRRFLDRQISLRQLTLSVDRPDDFVRALSSVGT